MHGFPILLLDNALELLLFVHFFLPKAVDLIVLILHVLYVFIFSADLGMQVLLLILLRKDLLFVGYYALLKRLHLKSHLGVAFWQEVLETLILQLHIRKSHLLRPQHLPIVDHAEVSYGPVLLAIATNNSVDTCLCEVRVLVSLRLIVSLAVRRRVRWQKVLLAAD